MTDKKKLLFICIGNMCRSPMAEGFARDMGGDVVEVYSAGIHPTGVISEDAILMMDEKDVNITKQTSNGLDAVPLSEIDIVVSMVGFPAKEFLPADFAGRIIDWTIEDPIGRPLGTFRRVRDEIEARVRDLIEDIRSANYSSRA
jgi:arsenate reductase